MEKQYKYFEFTTKNGNKVRFFKDQFGFGGLNVNDVGYTDSEVFFSFDKEKNNCMIYFSKFGERRNMIAMPQKTLEEIKAF